MQREEKNLESQKAMAASTSGSKTCQDCGNKAKRECAHMRCRTCCKGRGFHCPTHVKSTWVPLAARSRALKHQLFAAATYHHHIVPTTAVGAYDHPRPSACHLQLQPSLLTRSHPQPVVRSTITVSERFPAEVNCSATLRRIQLRSVDNEVDQYAYQTSLAIGGHMFKGILYQQQNVDRLSSTTNEPDQQATHTTIGTGSFAPTVPLTSGASFLHPSTPLHSSSFSAFIPGMQFFPRPR